MKKGHDSHAVELAIKLLQGIIENNPNSRLQSTTKAKRAAAIESWSKDISLLIRKDKQAPALIERVIHFATTDDFWQSNILSGRKLREKWDTLVLRMGKQSTSNHKKEVLCNAAGIPLKKIEGRVLL